MANDVFANGREIACKKADGKSICAFPDVCFTPPENPATPPGVPIPYPNTGKAKDMTSGSKKVKISDNEIMLKNKSYFKKSYGNEAGSAAKKGVVTSVNKGKVYFIAWSMDVKVEGKNAVRHLDMTTHNHASPTTNTPPWAHIDTGVFATSKNCKQARNKVKKKCTGDKEEDCKEPYKDNPCVKAKRCQLVPKNPKSGCCPKQTGHHLVPKHHFEAFKPTYKQEDAPCVCSEGHSWHRSDRSNFPDEDKTHPIMHDLQDATERLYVENNWEMHYDEAREIGIATHKSTFKSNCDQCLREQLDAYHNNCGVQDDSKMKVKATGSSELPENVDELWKKMDRHCDAFFGN